MLVVGPEWTVLMTASSLCLTALRVHSSFLCQAFYISGSRGILSVNFLSH